MTTKTIIIGALAVAGAWLVFGSGSSAADLASSASGGAAKRAGKVGALGLVPDKSVRIQSGTVPGTSAPDPRKRSAPVKFRAADINRPTSGVVNIGTIGTDSPFRGAL